MKKLFVFITIFLFSVSCKQYSEKQILTILESGNIIKYDFIERLNKESSALKSSISNSLLRKLSVQEMAFIDSHSQNKKFYMVSDTFFKKINRITCKIDTILYDNIIFKKSKKPDFYQIDKMNRFWKKEKKDIFLIQETNLFLQKMKFFCKKENIKMDFDAIENKLNIKNSVQEFSKLPVGIVWANIYKIHADLLLFYNSILKQYLFICKAKEKGNPRKNNAQIKIFITEEKKKWRVGETYKAQILLHDYIYPKITKAEINGKSVKVKNDLIEYDFKPSQLGIQRIEGKICLQLFKHNRQDSLKFYIQDTCLIFSKYVEVLPN